MSVQRILAQINNAVPTATVAASSVLPADRQVFQQQTIRAGNGTVAISGSYSGAADATLDIEIRTPSTGAETATTPVFSGAGNGTLGDVSIDGGTVAQDITVTLVDLGTETTRAQAILYADVLLQAKTAGAGGNAITLNLTPTLTLSAAPVGALVEKLDRGTQEWTDQRLDFGSKALNPDGTVPADAPRLVFGRDLSRVYRHYKRWDGEQWQYGLSPKLAASYPQGSEVHTVTGSYSAVVTDGVTPETYSSLITLYDLLIALGASALISVATPPANNKKPGGMAAIDMPFRTAAFALPVEKGRAVLPDLTGITVASTAPTESVTLECIDDRFVNQETWSVKSKVAGALAAATTGTPYTGGGFVGFTVPTVALDSRPVDGRIGISAESYPRDAGDETGTPAICLYRPIIGAAAKEKSLRLVWTQHPSDDCSCEDSSVTGGPREEFLGVDLGEEDMAALLAGHRARLEALTNWYKTFVAANTEKTAAGEVRSAEHDIRLAELAAGELNDCLTDLYTNADAVLVEDSWTGSTAYAVDAVVEPATPNGYRYRATVGGTSSGSAPTWPTTIGNTVTDGGITWKCVTKTAPLAWDDVLSGLDSDLSTLEAISSDIGYGISPRAVSTAYSVGALAYFVYSSVFYYIKCTTAGTSSASTSPISAAIQTGTAITDGTAKWICISRDEALADAQTNSTSDIDTIIARPTIDPGIVYDEDSFVSRYATACDEVRAIAGLYPKKSNAGLQGSAIWRDFGTDYWVVSGEDYLPIFSNVYYHACVEKTDADGNAFIEPTYEFGFAVRVGCTERLEYGDSITITIGDVSVNRPYAKGDTYSIPVVQGGPLAFAGGVTGDDTLTWTVNSSAAGALTDYAIDLDEDHYAHGGLNFTIHRGGIPFALGDKFEFSVEVGGRFRWRKDAGSWSSDTAIADTVSLADGLSALFQAGAAPAFVYGDTYSYTLRQPNAPDHTQSAHGDTWQWSSTGATLTLTWASDQTISTVGLLRHGLVSPATVSIVLKNSSGTTLETITPTVSNGPLLTAINTPLTTVRSMIVTVASATGMSIGWVYAGVPFAAPYDAKMTWRRSYAMDRSNGINPRAAYLGAGRSGEMTWQDFLSQEAADTLLAMIDDCKADGDAPIVIVPQILFPQDAILARIDTDAVELTDWYEFQPDDRARRALSLTLPLAPVLS